MQNVGTVKEIWRYPVKGMAGESLSTCHLSEIGLRGDRQWALRDERRNEIQSCKFRPDLLRCSAQWRGSEGGAATDSVEVVFPDGDILSSDQPEIHTKLSSLVGHPSRLEALRSGEDLSRFRRYRADDHTWLEELKATFEREEGEPLPSFINQVPQAVMDYASLPGTFFLVAPLHIVTTATLAYLRQVDGKSDWDMRRFRPNVVVETAPGYDGLVEQGWLGQQLQVGEAVIACTETTPRCGATVRAQRDFGADPGVLRTVVREADQNVGIYGQTAIASTLQVGDTVWLK
ncbi:MAG TPA: MOSC N-terminal beta barrel domain-containing protein [Candidatus Obscuribacterales bacterium]